MSGAHAPDLGGRPGSWVLTSPAGKVVEVFERHLAETAVAHGWTAETAMTYLCRINREIRRNIPTA